MALSTHERHAQDHRHSAIPPPGGGSGCDGPGRDGNLASGARNPGAFGLEPSHAGPGRPRTIGGRSRRPAPGSAAGRIGSVSLIAADTSAVLHFLHGVDGPARPAVRRALRDERLVLPPLVLTELLSAPSPESDLDALLGAAPLVPVIDGYWERAALNRRALAMRGLKSRLADALIAQSCIDAGIPLISGDSDFRHFAAHCGLKLAD
ncbi:PIN domain-containing protein [Brevundimonas intermedia]|uniref:Ribonuclease VapC n=1 Tax=Brevundimonas intermedia TaxID=74315 RepID=A0A4Y9RVZ6_9CAUL|nr:PIN domain-containing protein [Brevundimonas intermedia]